MMLGSTIFFSKTCLLLLFYRIFSPDRIFRYKLYGAFAFIATTTLSSIPMYLAICLPSSKGSWAEGQKKCGKTSVYSYVQGPAAVIFDLFVIYLPASVVVYLHMPLRRKIGILAIFMTGLLWVKTLFHGRMSIVNSNEVPLLQASSVSYFALNLFTISVQHGHRT